MVRLERLRLLRQLTPLLSELERRLADDHRDECVAVLRRVEEVLRSF